MREEKVLETAAASKSSAKEYKRRRCRSHVVNDHSETHCSLREVREGSITAQKQPSEDDVTGRRTIKAKRFHCRNREDTQAEKKGGDKQPPPLKQVQNAQTNSDARGTLIKGFEGNPKSNGSKESNGKERNGLFSENSRESSLFDTPFTEKDVKPYIYPRKFENIRSWKKMDFTIDSSIFFDAKEKENEVEMIKEYESERGVKGEMNGDKESTNMKASGSGLVLKKEFEDEDNDVRDEGEDDRVTVVFDKNIRDGATASEEVFEMVDKRIQNVKKKFKKREMNRTKRKLVKFKRKKNLVGRNLALWWIISQLQKYLTVDSEQAYHFLKAVNAQQENFNKEIGKNQKTITGDLGRMLSPFGNAAAEEFAKRTPFNKKDIPNVITRCILFGGREEKKKSPGNADRELTSPQVLSPMPCGMVDSSKKLIDDKMETLLPADTVQQSNPARPIQALKPTKESLNAAFMQSAKNATPNRVPIPPSQYLHPSPYFRPPKPPQRPSMATSAEGSHPTTYFSHLPSGPLLRTPLPVRGNFQPRQPRHSQQKPYFCPQKNFAQNTHPVFKDPRFRHFLQFPRALPHGNHPRPSPSRPVPIQPVNITVQYCREGFFPAAGDSIAMQYPRNSTVEFSQVPRRYGPLPRGPPTAGKTSGLALPTLAKLGTFSSGSLRDKGRSRSPVHHFPQVPGPCSLGAAVRSMPAHPGRSQGNAICPSECNHLRRNNVFLSPTSFGCGAPAEAFEEQCPLRTLANLAGFAPSQAHAVTELLRNPEQLYGSLPVGQATVEPEKCDSDALDPTVPLKLTMRNHRLEAEPILPPKKESSKSEGGESGSRWHETSPAASSRSVGSADRKNHTSRVYVCAQSGCKNPGVRICKGCLSVIYCGETCQLKHWSLKHKTECYQLKELRG